MFGAFRSIPCGSTVRGHLVTVIHALSIAVGSLGAWLTMGVGSLYAAAAISVAGLLVVYMLRSADGVSVGYESGLLAGVLTVCWLGLIVAFGLLGFIWVCALVATTRPLRSLFSTHVARRSGGGVARGGGRVVASPPAEADQAAARLHRDLLELPGLDLVGLCSSWRRSYFQLLDAGSPNIAAIVDHRQRILDEMARRDPAGFSRWLASGPRASGNPLPYLQGHVMSTDPDGSDRPRSGPERRHEGDGT